MRNPLPRRGHNELFRKKLLSPGAAPQQVDRVSAQSRQPLPHLDRLPNSGNLGNETAGPNRATGRVRHQAVEIVVVATGVARSEIRSGECVPPNASDPRSPVVGPGLLHSGTRTPGGPTK